MRCCPRNEAGGWAGGSGVLETGLGWEHRHSGGIQNHRTLTGVAWEPVQSGGIMD